ncbi:DUF6705 family protein [Chryseobacterium taihuense]|uniref:DUF6705 domain-containing protein n=1 Tax=Chryseobacterium taihuense TaxID=1141221 RepID=A0ABY0QZL7_9FLAO|nr:DUF6705 family protein [Chryseobacterium taihuense]SDM15605.1 hypothetical protein SAMN05216273_1155 [Chryseobacterium taihuense]
MKNILTILLLSSIFYSAFAQQACATFTEIPLRTFTTIPQNECYYLKDTNNELNDYVGTWKAMWNNKIVFVTFKKIINKYNNTLHYNKDYLIASFKTLDINGNILYDNTFLDDDSKKIKGGKFRKADDRYSLVYIDLCHTSGDIRINFNNLAKTELQWNYLQDKYEWLDSDCFFYNYPPDQLPNPLPKAAIFVKQ